MLYIADFAAVRGAMISLARGWRIAGSHRRSKKYPLDRIMIRSSSTSLRSAWLRTMAGFSSYACSLIVLVLLSGSLQARAQSVATFHEGSLKSDLDSPASASDTSSVVSGEVMVLPAVASSVPEAPRQHRFWDTENRLLFVAVGGLSAADFAVTRANLRAGGRELNPITRLFGDSTAGLAVNFVGETAVIVGLSYYFHRTRHHQLERLTSILNIGASSFAVGYDLSRR